MTATQVATLGGGCFWCLDAAFRQLAGVCRSECGYCGGSVPQPTYRQVCSGDTGHAEVVRLVFDPALIDYRTLLEAFFAVHDPTTPNRQGHDVGSQYRSVIFTHTPEQARLANELTAELGAAGVWPAPIVTQILPAPEFWPAEDEHQDYWASHPHQPYCLAAVAPKAAKLRHLFPNRLKDGTTAV
jgi:peptide-methionine (S)-S-oxide reductase